MGNIDFTPHRREIGRAIHDARCAKGISIREMEAMLGYRRGGNVVRIESGESGYNIDTLLAIIKALDLNLHIASDDGI